MNAEMQINNKNKPLSLLRAYSKSSKYKIWKIIELEKDINNNIKSNPLNANDI